MIHVILSGGCPLTREALKQTLEQHGAIRVVAEASSPMELLYFATLEQADAVVLEAEEESGMPTVLSHLFVEFPQIVAVVVRSRGNRVVVYRQQLCARVFDGISLADILSELHTADSDYWARADH